MDLDLRSPDHSTLSRRANQLDIQFPTVGRKTAIHLVVDSTGLQIVGQGPWSSAKHGERERVSGGNFMLALMRTV